MNEGGLEAFRQAVYADSALGERLWEPIDRAAFVEIVLREAQARGYDIDRRELEEAMQAGRRAWIERWLP